MMERKAEKKTTDRKLRKNNRYLFLGETDLYLAKETDTTSAATAHAVLVPKKNTRKKIDGRAGTETDMARSREVTQKGK
jgi:hypothetical protein